MLSEARVAIDEWDPAFFRGEAEPPLVEGRRSIVVPMNAPRKREEPWDLYLAHDFGSAAPSVTFLCARSPDDLVTG